MSAAAITNFLDVSSSDGFFDKYGDPRVRDWFLLQNPLPVFVILAIYFYFCTSLGPKLMKNRPPFKLKKAMIIYNFVNVVGSIWLCNELLQGGWLTSYNFTCQPIDYSNKPEALRMAGTGWTFFMFKLFELLDTVFFVLRKKDVQITFLHIYHHTHVPLLTWATAKFWSGGHGSLPGLLNVMVHIVMYSYYFLAALGPQWQKYLWWKKYLTGLQLVQFAIVVVHQGQIFFNGCDYPKLLPLIHTMNSTLFLYLFGSFYVKMYWNKNEKHVKVS